MHSILLLMNNYLTTITAKLMASMVLTSIMSHHTTRCNSLRDISKCTWTHVQTYTCTHPHVHTHMYMCTHTHPHPYIYTYTHTHACTHIHTHTHTHTHSHTEWLTSWFVLQLLWYALILRLPYAYSYHINYITCLNNQMGPISHHITYYTSY